MFSSILFCLTSFSVCLILLLETIKWVAIWQRKEYRLDRFLDFASSLEGRNAFKDSLIWVKGVLCFLILILSILYGHLNFSNNSFVQPVIFALLLAYTLNFSCLSLNVVNTFSNLANKQITRPRLTLKALTILFLVCFQLFLVVLFVGICYISRAFWHIYGLDFDTQLLLGVFRSEYSMISFTTLANTWCLSFLVPFLTGLSILILQPVQKLIQKRLFEKALVRRKSFKNLQVIAISGSYGKTSIKEFLEQILSQKFRVQKTQDYQNTSIACAKRMANLKEDTEIFICEIGTYKKGESTEICNFILPTISLITGLNDQHINLFGNQSNILEAETESLNYLKEGSIAFINRGSDLSSRLDLFKLTQKKLKIRTYGIENPNLHYTSSEINLNSNSQDLAKLQTNFKFEFKYSCEKLQTNLLSKGNVENLTGAIGLAMELGVDLESIKTTIQDLTPPKQALETLDTDFGQIIDDTHNANFDGTINALDLLQNLPNTEARIIIFDEIIELGQKAEYFHLEIVQKILASDPSLVVFLSKSYGEIMQNSLVSKGFEGKNVILASDKKDYQEALVRLKQFCDTPKQKPTIVLAEGRRSQFFVDKLVA